MSSDSRDRINAISARAKAEMAAVFEEGLQLERDGKLDAEASARIDARLKEISDGMDHAFRQELSLIAAQAVAPPPSRKRFIWPVIGLGAFVLAVSSRGFDFVSITIAVVFLILFLIPLYLESRPKNEEPSRLEIFVASLWLWVRRIVCTLGAAAFLAAALIIPFKRGHGMEDIVLAVIFLILGSFCIWTGWFGRFRPWDLRRDIAAHRDRKRRYNGPG